MLLLLTIIGGLLVTGCGNGNNESQTNEVEPSLSAAEMVNEMLAKVEQPSMMDLTADQVQEFYNIDPAKLEEYSIKVPMMNVKSNEIAVIKVKNTADVAEAEEAIKKRAETVQQQFEMYLPDQYENAKNYKLVTKGNYILFVISDQADELVSLYESFFNK